MSLKNIIQNRSYGTYVTLGALVVSIIAAIVYAACYHNLPRFMSWGAIIAIIVGVVASLILMIPNNKLLNEVAPGVIAVCDLVAVCLFIQAIYNYVVVVMVGIDLHSVDASFVVTTTFLSLSLVASIVSIFLPQSKEVKE